MSYDLKGTVCKTSLRDVGIFSAAVNWILLALFLPICIILATGGAVEQTYFSQ